MEPEISQNSEIPAMFRKLQLRDITIPNRVGMSPLCMYQSKEGHANDFHVVHLGSRAIGGFGLVFAEMAAVSPEGRISTRDAGVWLDSHIAPWKRVVDFVHQRSASAIAIQLGHAGRKADTGVRWLRGTPEGQEGAGGFRTIAPSAIPFVERYKIPTAIPEDDVPALVQKYVDAAKRVDQAGFDLVELHFAHGYLISSFLSPLSNKRNDSLGGSLEARMELPLRIYRSVREVWPESKPIASRISAIDWEEGGNTIEDAVEIAKIFQNAGLDILDISSGMVTHGGRPESEPKLFQVPFSAKIREAANIPTMTVGGVQDADAMNQIIGNGQADICLMGRAALYNPYFVRHAARNLNYNLQWPDEYISADNVEVPIP
jgi:anthraniloyl-CoA monooxygenase